MVQILPHIPGFGERLIDVAGKATSDVATGYGKYKQNQKDADTIKQLNSGDVSPINAPILYSKLSKGAQENYKPFLESQIRQREFKAKEEVKSQEKQKEEERSREEFRPTIDKLESLVDVSGFAGPTLRNIPGTQAYQDSKEFDSLGFLAADKVYTHFNKGTISEAKLKVIQEDLAPRTGLSQTENRGRIQALRTIMALPKDAPEKQVDAVLKKVSKGLEPNINSKVEKGTKVTSEIADKFLQESGGDPEKARQKAKELGYSF